MTGTTAEGVIRGTAPVALAGYHRLVKTEPLSLSTYAGKPALVYRPPQDGVYVQHDYYVPDQGLTSMDGGTYCLVHQGDDGTWTPVDHVPGPVCGEALKQYGLWQNTPVVTGHWYHHQTIPADGKPQPSEVIPLDDFQRGATVLSQRNLYSDSWNLTSLTLRPTENGAAFDQEWHRVDTIMNRVGGPQHSPFKP